MCSWARAGRACSPTATIQPDRGSEAYGRKVLQEFVRAGAPEEIIYVNKPHIGTFRLAGVVAAMRAEIIALGGEVRFENKVTDLVIEKGRLEGVHLGTERHCAAGTSYSRSVIVLATPFACSIDAVFLSSPSLSLLAFASSIRSR